MRTIAVLLITVGAWGQSQAPGQKPTGPIMDAKSNNLPAQKIGANDLISVFVYNAPEVSGSLRVGGDGFIRLPMLKQRIKVQGLMPAEVEAAIAAGLKHEQILVDPYVTVTMEEYHSRPISVMGAVKTPVTFQAEAAISLLDALAKADGLSPEAGPEIMVTHKQVEDDGTTTSLVQRIPVKSLIDAADPEMNVKLTGGEEIRVPTAGKIYVLGNVKSAGSFAMQDASESSVLRALALAGGLAPLAAKKAFIYRREADGSKNEIPVELSKIMDRKAADATILPDDILYIPDAKGTRATFAALEKIVMYGSGASTAMIYAGVK